MIRAEAVVDVGAIERNCSRIAAGLDEAATLCAVVKAGGYGHGAIESARAAIRGGARCLAVATADEAVELRAAISEAPLLVMGALSGEELKRALAAEAEVAVWTEEFLGLVEAAGGGRVHVKYDTGMGRLGEADPERVLALLDRARALGPAAVWTHYATADEDDTDHLERQLARFSALLERLPATAREGGGDPAGRILAHASNSAATLHPVAPDFDMVRCGIAIYGLDPFQRDPAAHGLEPALTLRTRVGAVKRFRAGASAGYGRRWSAERDTWVAVLPIGYADGVRRALSNNADVLIGGRRYPLVGTVSMDNVTVDLGPETDVDAGEEAVLIGAQGSERILCEELARHAGTINYEIVTGIGPRVPRRYVGAGDDGGG